MFSVSPSEFIVIAIVALIVVGPTRLVEMSRKAGQFAGRLRAAADDLRRGLESEVDDVVAPFREARTQIAATGKELKETAQGELKWVDTNTDSDGNETKAETEADAGKDGEQAETAADAGKDGEQAETAADGDKDGEQAEPKDEA